MNYFLNRIITTSLVSIIMPACNAERFIEASIISVLNQTYKEWELIIIDDGSVDRTAEIALFYVKMDSRILYFYQNNGKQGKARNLGLKNSSGDFIAFLDSDDLWLSNKLEVQLKQIQEKGVDLVFSDSYIFFNDDVNDVQKRMEVKQRFYTGMEAIDLFIEFNRIPLLTVLVKKSKIRALGDFIEDKNIQFGEDYHLWLKLLLNGSVFYSTDLVLAKYRVHNESVTINESSQQWKLMEMFYDLSKINPVFKPKFVKKVQEMYISFYLENRLSKDELKFYIKKNTAVLSKQNQELIYLFLNRIFPAKLTRRVLIYLLNEKINNSQTCKLS
jgi:glycosyltransferase involved in cell wall biosynthesis